MRWLLSQKIINDSASTGKTSSRNISKLRPLSSLPSINSSTAFDSPSANLTALCPIPTNLFVWKANDIGSFEVSFIYWNRVYKSKPLPMPISSGYA